MMAPRNFSSRYIFEELYALKSGDDIGQEETKALFTLVVCPAVYLQWNKLLKSAEEAVSQSQSCASDQELCYCSFSVVSTCKWKKQQNQCLWPQFGLALTLETTSPSGNVLSSWIFLFPAHLWCDANQSPEFLTFHLWHDVTQFPEFLISSLLSPEPHPILPLLELLAGPTCLMLPFMPCLRVLCIVPPQSRPSHLRWEQRGAERCFSRTHDYAKLHPIAWLPVPLSSHHPWGRRCPEPPLLLYDTDMEPVQPPMVGNLPTLGHQSLLTELIELANG
ncbi:hypothetical protein E2C01_032563 [Portunus trituberculatus]|uniref:Uncharacterized protein n=1 Tax=Portunus trituberculatus TaxID=210409 RepID=A0A5B7EZY8_PORTR|nr:hypothetical protein [Portunus trituberculatus]